MDEETREALVETLRSVKRTKKTHHFWMISKAEDGEPLLMVHKKAAILARDARAARKTAKVKIPATGPLLWSSEHEGLVFVNEGAMGPPKMLKIFKKLATDPIVKKVAPWLKSAQIVTPEELASMGLEVEEDDEDGFDDLFDRVRATVVGLRDAFHGSEHAGAADDLAKDVKAAKKAHRKGDTSGATEALNDVDERATALAKKGWDGLVDTTREQFVTTREALDAQLGEAGRIEELAPLVALQRRAVKLHKSGKLAAAVQALFQLHDALHELRGQRLVLADDDPFDGDETLDRAQDAIEQASEAFEAAGEPGSAFGPLAAAREAFLDERYLEVQDLLEKRFWPALETAREVGTASTARLAKLRTAFEGDLERSRTEVARYLSAVKGDGEVPAGILTSHGKAFEARVDKLVPSRAEHVLRALREACDASGDALRPALGAVTDAAAKCRTELSVIRGSSPELEKSAFGSFAVHAHLDASLESIIGAATSMAGREA